MKHLLLIFVLATTTFFTQAQTKDDPFFNKVQALLEKAEGKKYTDFHGKRTVGKQEFKYELVSFQEKQSKNLDYINKYTNIDWSVSRYSIRTVDDNDKLMIITIHFKEQCVLNKFTQGFPVGNQQKIDFIEQLHFLSADHDAMKALFDAIITK